MFWRQVNINTGRRIRVNDSAIFKPTIHYAYQIRETELVAKDITTAGNQPKIFDIEPFGPDIMVASSKAINEDKYEMFSLSPANGIELGLSLIPL